MSSARMVAIDWATWRSGRMGADPRLVGFRQAGRLTGREPDGRWGGKPAPPGAQKPISRDAQRGVVMKAAPAPPLKVAQTDLLLEFLIIPLDAPAQFRQINKVPQDGVLRQGREPVLGRPLLAFRPFDQTPLLRSQGRAPVVAVR